RRRDDDSIFEHTGEPAGDYVLDVGGEIVATAGFMLHYNMPFADLYMEVRKDRRGRGLGSCILQEVQKECYLAGRVPAARTGLQEQTHAAHRLRRAAQVLDDAVVVLDRIQRRHVGIAPAVIERQFPAM